MSDPLRDVSPGESPARLLNAATFNAQMEAARWVRRHGRGAMARAGGGPVEMTGMPPRLEVRVRPSADLAAGAVVRLTAPLIAADSSGAVNTPVFGTAAPATAADLVAVLPAPVEGGTVGRGVVAGVAVAAVSVTDTGHRFAAPDPGNSANLVSAASGPIRLLDTFSSTGTHTTFVLLGVGGSGEPAACDWAAGLTADDCVRVTVVSATGACAGIETAQAVPLAWDAEDDWAAGDVRWQSAAGAFAHALGTARVVFGLASGVPFATLGAADGTPLGCDGDGGLLFGFGGPELCDGAAGECDNALVLRFECHACPLDPGWYCVADTDADPDATPEAGPWTVIEVLEGQDTAEIDALVSSGPFETEEEAADACFGVLDALGSSCVDPAGLMALGQRIELSTLTNGDGYVHLELDPGDYHWDGYAQGGGAPSMTIFFVRPDTTVEQLYYSTGPDGIPGFEVCRDFTVPSDVTQPVCVRWTFNALNLKFRVRAGSCP